MNIQCAIQFLVSPIQYLSEFELSGISGETAVRGMAILFLMWNVPYIFAAFHPVRFKVSYLQAIIMQIIGLLGEFMLTYTLPAGHPILRNSLSRFILFDGTGLLVLLAGYLIIRRTPLES